MTDLPPMVPSAEERIKSIKKEKTYLPYDWLAEEHLKLAHWDGQQSRQPEIDALRADLRAALAEAERALDYVCERTYCGRDAEWHFKPGYDPQIVIDALARIREVTDDG